MKSLVQGGSYFTAPWVLQEEESPTGSILRLGKVTAGLCPGDMISTEKLVS